MGEGTGWTVTEPYAPMEVDGMLYGRGTDDDKGPVAAVLLAMKAVRSWASPPAKRPPADGHRRGERLSATLPTTIRREPYAPCTFSPDREVPVINLEKGSYKPVFTKSWAAESATPRVKEFRGGFRINVLPAEASCVVAGLSAGRPGLICDKAAAETGVSYELREEGDDLHILCKGKGAHASTPEEGVNAITGLIHLLCTLPLAKVGSTATLHALNALFPHGDTRQGSGHCPGR